jgi:hypothetical protein
MTQAELDRAVAAATGESVSTIRRPRTCNPYAAGLGTRGDRWGALGFGGGRRHKVRVWL